MAQEQQTVPHLYHLVRSALSIVFGSSPHGGVDDAHRLQHKQAHDFLVGFQKASSRRGKQNGIFLNGSTFLTCIYILVEDVNGNGSIQDYERIFMAQTLVTRLRNMNSLEDAMDLEKEEENIMSYIWNQMKYNFNIQGIPTTLPGLNSNKMKGSFSYGLTSMQIFIGVALNNMNRIVSNNSSLMLDLLSSAVALISLRLKYNGDKSILHHLPSLVEMVAKNVGLMTNYVLSKHNKQVDNLKVFSGRCFCSMLGAIPNEVCDSLGSSSRLSMDPRFHTLAIKELRSSEGGLNIFTTSIKESLAFVSSQAHLPSNYHAPLLFSCEKWARAVPLTPEFLDDILPLALLYIADNESVRDPANNHIYLTSKEASLNFLNAICERATLSPTELGIMLKIPNIGKRIKKQRTKTEKKDESNNSAIGLDESSILSECHRMKEIACLVASQTLPYLTYIEEHSCASLISSYAQICLPFLSSKQYSFERSHGDRENLQTIILDKVLLMSQSINREIRSLSFEPLLALCDVGNELDCSLNPNFFKYLSKCGLQLMKSCRYPEDYFDDLTLDSDHDLEVERNNVRDVIRSLGCLSPVILANFVNTCHDDPGVNIHVAVSSEMYNLPSEDVLHTMSALAKPLNRLATSCDNLEEDKASILVKVLALVGRCSKNLSILFRRDQFHLFRKYIFPISRLCCIAVASYSPFLSTICELSNQNEIISIPHCKYLWDVFGESFRLCIDQSLMSLRFIPEYASTSSLGENQYDIRGAMCGPGGEDHVGCLVVMRFVDEGETLSMHLASIDSPSFPLFREIVRVHDELKMLEVRRGLQRKENEMTTPMTRRIILRAFSKLASKNQNNGSEYIESLFQSSLNVLSSFIMSNAYNGDDLYRLCEEVFDLSFFGNYSSNLFSPDFLSLYNAASNALQNIIMVVKKGYYTISVQNLTSSSIQWSRLRGAVYNLIRVCLKEKVTGVACDIIVALNQAECEAFVKNWPIFHEDLMCEEVLPAGAFIHILGESLKSIYSQYTGGKLSATEMYHTTLMISQSLDRSRVILGTILTNANHSESKYIDPRPFMSEGWYEAMNYLLMICSHCQDTPLIREDSILALFYDSCVGAIVMFLSQTNSKETHDGSISMDAPHTLIVIEFLQSIIPQVPNILDRIGHELRSRLIVKCGIPDVQAAISNHEWMYGGSILTASLMRGSSGALPPWAIESIPDMFSSIFTACGCNITNFLMIVNAAMFLIFESGNRVAGKYFERISDASSSHFLDQAQESARRNDSEGWRRFKCAVKNLCGGKKKDSGFNLKPALTSWDCSRI